MKKVCVITGGGSGMGFETAKILAHDGWHLILVGRTKEKLQRAADEIKAAGGDAGLFACDVSDRESVQKLAAFTAACGEVKAVIHAAGLSPHMGDAETILRGNALGTINVNDAFYEVMAPGGCLIDTSSMSAYLTPAVVMPRGAYPLCRKDTDRFLARLSARVRLFPKSTRTGVAYSISKDFVIWYARTDAARFGQKGIRVLSVTPGNFETPMGNLEKEEAGSYLSCNAIPRFGRPEEIAQLYADLIDERLGYLTGTDILCDGGCIAGGASAFHRGRKKQNTETMNHNQEENTMTNQTISGNAADSRIIYLVTGAAGFLGSHICSELLERGDRVRALVLPGDPAMKYVPAAVEIVEGNLCDRASLEPFFRIPEGRESVVIHCASMVTVNPDFNQKLIDINVGGTRNMIDLCLAHPECRRMVYVSSTGAIPETPKGTPIREVSSFDPELVVGCYSQSKAMATQAVLDAVNTRGLHACVVHPSGILGPEDHAVSETTGTIIRIVNGEMPVGMRGSFNLCDVRDLAHGCVMAADRGRSGECYILGNKEVTLKQVCDILCAESGCRKPAFYLPLPVAELFAKIMERKAAKDGSKPLMTTFSVYNLKRNNTFDCSKAEKELGYHTRSYAETLRDEVAWLRREGKAAGTGSSANVRPVHST